MTTDASATGARPRRTAAVIVAHPDDETLWAGGLILAHREYDWFIASLCRGGDADRAPRFARVVAHFGAQGTIANLDDGPDQEPLAPELVSDTVLSLLSGRHFDLLVTHGPLGEYTRHRRHEETSAAVSGLWQAGRLSAGELWLFAYEDGGRAYLPRVAPGADRVELLPEAIWQEKYRIVTALYNFAPESWEARTTPRREGFCRLTAPPGRGHEETGTA
ncbi:MAG TPA: PIG-L family deacetylase [Anaerolineae bacterium]